ncbi:MAG: amino acid permease, partial [Candidatus Latescibacteria bacterium]|nr:amino acid permease [Candidatus Latescibacterota bacterium]
ITFLTALSISAIATDQRVRTGGAYYMISRSLGIETGGAIGVPLYFAQALSIALYTVGFAESVANVFPVLDEKSVAIVTTVFVALVALKSIRAAIKVQYVIMALIGLSLLSFISGRPIEQTEVVLWGAEGGEHFWMVFAVFFPAVTGIMAGVNMSGDLEDAGRSLPRGTLAAVGTGYLIYMLLPFLLALRASTASLIDDPLVMRRIALWGDAILLGVWGATLSSAVGSILGAPRVLQALARDGILPRWLSWLGRGSGAGDEPRIGTAITLAVALVAVYFGNLNMIAPVLTMFFLTTYGVLNITAGLERFLGNPSFRPRFKVHWFWSLLGAIGCAAIMLLINAVAAIISAVCVFSIFLWLKQRELKSTWGSVGGGIWMALAGSGLLRLKKTTDPKNWRPHLLVLLGSPTRRWHLVDMAASLTHNRALMTVSAVLPEETGSAERLSAMESTISEYLIKQGIQSLVRVTSAPNPYLGAVRLIETYGLGALVPNTVLMGYSDEYENRGEYFEMISGLHQARRNVAIMHYNAETGFGTRHRIDVWWGGLRKNGGLMMILAYLLRTSRQWRNAEVCVKMVVPTDAAVEGSSHNLAKLVEDLRTGATTRVIVADGRPFDEILRESSRRADLIFLGLAKPEDDFVSYCEELQRRIEGLPTTIFVLASEDMAFEEILLQYEHRSLSETGS